MRMSCAAANAAMLHWLKAPALPRPFVMDLLDFVLGNSAPVFRELPAFEHALLLRVCALLTTQLQNLLDPLCEPSLQASDLRVTLRTVRTVIHHFHRQLHSKCGVFIETLLAGESHEPSAEYIRNEPMRRASCLLPGCCMYHAQAPSAHLDIVDSSKQIKAACIVQGCCW